MRGRGINKRGRGGMKRAQNNLRNPRGKKRRIGNMGNNIFNNQVRINNLNGNDNNINRRNPNFIPKYRRKINQNNNLNGNNNINNNPIINGIKITRVISNKNININEQNNLKQKFSNHIQRQKVVEQRKATSLPNVQPKIVTKPGNLAQIRKQLLQSMHKNKNNNNNNNNNINNINGNPISPPKDQAQKVQNLRQKLLEAQNEKRKLKIQNKGKHNIKTVVTNNSINNTHDNNSNNNSNNNNNSNSTNNNGHIKVVPKNTPKIIKIPPKSPPKGNISNKTITINKQLSPKKPETKKIHSSPNRTVLSQQNGTKNHNKNIVKPIKNNKVIHKNEQNQIKLNNDNHNQNQIPIKPSKMEVSPPTKAIKKPIPKTKNVNINTNSTNINKNNVFTPKTGNDDHYPIYKDLSKDISNRKKYSNKQFLDETDKFIKDLYIDLKTQCELTGISYQEFTTNIPNNELHNRLNADIEWCKQYLKEFHQ